VYKRQVFKHRKGIEMGKFQFFEPTSSNPNAQNILPIKPASIGFPPISASNLEEFIQVSFSLLLKLPSHT